MELFLTSKLKPTLKCTTQICKTTILDH